MMTMTTMMTINNGAAHEETLTIDHPSQTQKRTTVPVLTTMNTNYEILSETTLPPHIPNSPISLAWNRLYLRCYINRGPIRFHEEGQDIRQDHARIQIHGKVGGRQWQGSREYASRPQSQHCLDDAGVGGGQYFQSHGLYVEEGEEGEK